MYKSVILPLAKEDIREAAKWYNKRQNGLGKRFTAEVREKVHFIRQNPKASNVRYDDVRTAVLNVFPFMVHFTIDEKNKTVIVSAVLHTSRDPELWKNR
ncbi:MAG: type II toxin-antitoxin system RelE/ParE family toxin [Prolixibacteraceae bacterium]|jgi:plasmid stabilization system protein ParE|nr:type II toxin-antitoxin system RelE/ParE family toxin [Prolixibacteraceae bacterium]